MAGLIVGNVSTMVAVLFQVYVTSVVPNSLMVVLPPCRVPSSASIC